MRFCANVSILFKEVPLLERFERARAAGFAAVELWWPSGEEPAEIAAAVEAAGLEVVLLNFDAGEMPAGDRGLISDPDRQRRFRENVPVALELAHRAGCRRLNALVGKELPGMSREEQLGLARENVRFAAERAAGQGAQVLIEAVNTFENGPYLLANTADAAEFVRGVERENVWLQYDVYHMQRMEGNIVANLRDHLPEISHVQIADSPGRGEPGTGELNYPYILGELARLGYEGHVGLEYNPSGEDTERDTEHSLRWLPQRARTGEVGVEDLDL